MPCRNHPATDGCSEYRWFAGPDQSQITGSENSLTGKIAFLYVDLRECTFLSVNSALISVSAVAARLEEHQQYQQQSSALQIWWDFHGYF
jgi:hypothetical protein